MDHGANCGSWAEGKRMLVNGVVDSGAVFKEPDSVFAGVIVLP